MKDALFDPIGLIVIVSLLSLGPLLAVTATSFLKISAVLLILRNALGLQQVPPNMALYGMAMVMSVVVMGGTFYKSVDLFKIHGQWPNTGVEIIEGIERASPVLKDFMKSNCSPESVGSMFEIAKKFNAKYGGELVTPNDFVVIMPAFVISEISAAFKIGFAIYLPFLVIDLAVSCILMALGMMMVSPMSIALPLKILLFVSIDGWRKLLLALTNSYL
ncbi:MAG TPA: type III secretion system export apparatus subunit SctR [Limnobacter sp.]|uniref:type III secretion system export apparatus subunit SctR n=1 Tax=Limnobacter sp. TaxID=2003368 RepID=UPI002EDA4FDD